ncbi:MAG: ABC transporter permease [Clostridiales bacterium]
MNDFVLSTSLFLQTAVQMGTPLLFGTLGGILCEKSGHLNLGVEGMMLMGAVMGFWTALTTGNPFLAILAAGLAGAFGALIYAVLTVTLRVNQVVTGLALTIFGTGFSSFIGPSLTGLSLPPSVTSVLASYNLPILSDIPILGKMLFSQSIYVHIALVAAFIIWFYLNKTRAGLNLKAVGENPAAADASGVNISLYKYLNILAGGFLCGLGGAYLCLVFVPRWQDNITAGSGWIAVALVIFATWHPLKAILGAYLFGALRGIGFKMQGMEFSFFGLPFSVSPQILDMIPYITTIVVLVMMSLKQSKKNQPPNWLGQSYYREDR